MKFIVSNSNSEKLLLKYGEHLRTIHGLAARTCDSRIFYAREFLQARLKVGRGKFKTQELTPEVLLQYVLDRSFQDSPVRLQALACGLRSFCRFLQVSGGSPGDLTSALPRIASPGRAGLPDYLTPKQLADLLGSINTKSAAGPRNYAIMLCLSRLGLRAGEVAGLSFDQIHWREGVVCLSGCKGRRSRELPLPKDVGRAIADYLRCRPERNASRQIFLARRNRQPLSSAAISQVTRRVLQQARIQTPRLGSHLLRRTLATHLVQKGVSLKAVADLLGHRSLDTTRIYVNVNHSLLREVARPWPQEVRR